MRVYLDGIGILGPGLDGWLSSQRILTGDQTFVESNPTPPMPTMLSSNERRRSSDTVKLALHVAQEAIDHSEVKPQEVGTVFASSDGDGMILHQLCSTLATPAPQISPTLFHHSVHNAPAGYWGISHHSQLPSTSISCHDGTFSAGLLEMAGQAVIEERPTLLVAYDIPAPHPLHEARPLLAAFGIALLCRHKQSPRSSARLDLRISYDHREELTTLQDPNLDKHRKGVPTARGLPLLAAIAHQKPTHVTLEYLDNSRVTVNMTPCP